MIGRISARLSLIHILQGDSFANPAAGPGNDNQIRMTPGLIQSLIRTVLRHIARPFLQDSGAIGGSVKFSIARDSH